MEKLFLSLLPIVFAILLVPYLFAMFLGLTVWREHVRWPRVLRWSAFFLSAAIVDLGFGLPVVLFMNAVDGDFSTYSQYSGRDPEFELLVVGGVFLMLVTASFCLCIAAIVPAPRPKMTPERNLVPTKHPVDD